MFKLCEFLKPPKKINYVSVELDKMFDLEYFTI